MLRFNDLMAKFDSQGWVEGSEVYQLAFFPYWQDKKITKEMFYLLTDLKNFVHYQFFTLDNIPKLTNQQVDIVDFLQGNLEYANVYDVNIHVLNWSDEIVVFNYLIERWNEEHNDGKMEEDGFYDYIFYQRARKEFEDEITIKSFDGVSHVLPLRDRFKICLQSSRGIGKSVISENLAPWGGLLDPDMSCIVVSADDNRATNFNKQVRNYVKNSDVLKHLIPAKGDTDSANIFNFGCRKPQDSPSFKSVGLYSKKMTGSRADILINDDVEVPNNVMTEKGREQLSERVKEGAAVLKTKKPGGIQRIIYLGTPQTEDTLYRKLPERGYILRVFPSRIPTEEQFKNMEETLCPRIRQTYLKNPNLRTGYGQFGDRGAAIDERMNETELVEREMEYGRVGYDQQYMLDPSGSDRDKYPLKLNDLIIADLDKEKTYSDWKWSSEERFVINDLANIGFTGDRFRTASCDETKLYNYESTIMAIDPSGEGKDETAVVILKELHGYLYLVESRGFKNGYDDSTLEDIVGLCKSYGVNKIVIEENFGGGMYEKLLTPFIKKANITCGIELVWSYKQKELKIIETLEPVLRQHRLVVDKGVVQRDYINTPDWVNEQEAKRNYMMFYQLTRITKDRGSLKHDDRLDALAMAVQYYSNVLCLDTVEQKDEVDNMLGQKVMQEGIENYIDSQGFLVSSVADVYSGRVVGNLWGK